MFFALRHFNGRVMVPIMRVHAGTHGSLVAILAIVLSTKYVPEVPRAMCGPVVITSVFDL